jgi:outer membrane receptor protein involved in Fe transport
MFYQQYRGYQARAVEPLVVLYTPDPNPTKMQGGLTFNADATVQGVELEFQSLLSERWSLNGGAAYIESRFDSGETGPCTRPLTPVELANRVEVAECDIGDERVSAQPLFSGNLSSEYYVPVGPTQWYIRGLYNYRSESTNYLVAGEAIDPYGILSLWTGFRSNDASWDVNLWVKNLTDEQQLTEVTNPEIVNFLGTTYVSNWRRDNMIQPRIFGVTARYNW